MRLGKLSFADDRPKPDCVEAPVPLFSIVLMRRIDGVDVYENTSSQADSSFFDPYFSPNFVRLAQALNPCSGSFPEVRK